MYRIIGNGRVISRHWRLDLAAARYRELRAAGCNVRLEGKYTKWTRIPVQ